MTAAELAARIPGVVHRRDAWFDTLCPVPIHGPRGDGDHRPSVSFCDEPEKHRVRVLCRGGCRFEAIVEAWGLRKADLYHDTNGNGHRPVSRVVEEYAYRDERGVLLYVVERREPKDFRFRQPDGRGGWTWKLPKSVRRVPYRLPELRDCRQVYIAEGERKVDRLARLGLPATCNAGGAGMWTDDLTAQVRAIGVESVVILPDNDKRGEEHADLVARSCVATGITAKHVRLPGLPEKGDIVDWLDAGHTAEELLALVAAAPPEAATTPPTPSTPFTEGPKLVRLVDVEPEEVTWLWPGRIPCGKLTILMGDPGLGKSMLTLDVSARLSTGMPWPDGGRAPLGTVILLSAEDGVADTIRPRVDRLGGDVTRIAVLEAIRTSDGERGFSLVADMPHLETAISSTGASLVVIDPLSAYLGDTDSYKDAEVRGLLAPLAAIATRTGAAIVAVMHLTKDTQRRAIYRAPGSIAFVGAARSVLVVGKDQENEERRLLATNKNNLSAPAPTLAFSIPGGVIEWEPDPVSNTDAEVVLSGPSTPEEREERKDAEGFLLKVLALGPRTHDDVKRLAMKAQIASRTLSRAKARLGVISERGGSFDDRSDWTWRLPPKIANPGQDCQFPYGETVAKQGPGGNPGSLTSTAAGASAAPGDDEVVL